MKVFQIQDDWSIEHLTLTERPVPKPGKGEVLLRMKAASLNYRDLVVPNKGYGRWTGTLPLIPISDGVGEIVETGAGVDRFMMGDRVCPIWNRSLPRSEDRWMASCPNTWCSIKEVYPRCRTI